MSVSTRRPAGSALTLVSDPAGAAGQVSQSLSDVTRMMVNAATRPRPAAPSEPRRVQLTRWQRMQVEQTRKLLMEAPDLFQTKPDAYVAGLIQGAAQTLLDVLDTVTQP